MRHTIRNKLNTTKRRRAAVVVLAACALALVGGAYAYFTSSGNGTDQAAVGGSSPFTVTFSNEAGTMFPGAGDFTADFTVTNPGGGRQRILSVTAAVKSVSGNITQGGTEQPGCQAGWFHTEILTDPSGTTLAVNGSADGTVKVTMDDSNTDQDACQGTTPDILVTAS